LERPLADKLLVALLLPLFAVCLFLHLREVRRSGLQQPPVYATSRGSDAYPVVGGVRIERGSDWSGLVLGDRLIEIGDTDLRGTGYVGFDAHALYEAAGSGAARLVFERDGQRREMSLVMQRQTLPWYRVPFMLSFVAVACLVLWRSPGSLRARLMFAGFVAFACVETPFFGGTPQQTYAHAALFHLGGPIAVGLLLAFFAQLPAEVPRERRASSWWGLLGILFPVARAPYFFDAPIPAHMARAAVLACDLLFFAVGFCLVGWNFAHAQPIGRRRVRWVIVGALFGIGPMAVTLSLQSLLDPATYNKLFEYSAIAAVLLPLGFVVSITRANLLDIDRLLSATTAYSLAIAGAVAAALAVVPPIGRAVAGAFDIELHVAQVCVALVLAGIAVPVGRRLHPLVERAFFPGRVALDRGFRRLLRDVSECDTAGEVLALLQRRIESLLELRSCVLFEPGGHGFAARVPAGALRVSGEGPLVQLLERDPVPLRAAPAELARALPELTAAEAEALAEVDARVLLPVRAGKDLCALLALGPKRSGDLFPTTELTLLEAVAEKASAELGRLHTRKALATAEERAVRLEQITDEAQAANRAKSRFLAAASHDLRQPLHALGLFTDRLSDHVVGDVGRALADQVQATTRALRQQFDALLDLSRLDAGGVEPDLRTFALAPELARIAAECSLAAREKGLAFRFEPVDAQVVSDPLLLARVIQNLLANAVRYTNAGEVVLRARRDGEQLAIEVADTGPGIPRDRQREIFSEFYRLDPRAGDGGLGLGLAIVERTTRLLGHALCLESEPQRGSLFRVTVPLAADAPATRTRGSRAGAIPAGLVGRRVLIVEDEPAVLDAMRRLLESWGCRVSVAHGLAAATDALSSDGGPPDAIIADYRLGEAETGLDVIERIRFLSGVEVPAVLVSGEAAREPLGAIRDSGLRYLPKPVPPAKLRALLAELLRRESGGAAH
jgi:signal transduction histidine kinase/ActR/RegA family two-component response regulator